jgi:hypothetical protein
MGVRDQVAKVDAIVDLPAIEHIRLSAALLVGSYTCAPDLVDHMLRRSAIHATLAVAKRDTKPTEEY